MPKTELDAALWFESELEDKPMGARSRAELVALETGAIAWRAAKICAPFEVLLLPWGESRTLCSSAFARPLGAADWPWIALGSHRFDGPRLWQGGGAQYNEPHSIGRHLRRALPALLARRLWGRVLWLDRELNLADESSGVLRLYLGANGQGQWFLPETAAPRSLRAGFEWKDENRSALLLALSDEELLEWVYAQAELEGSDLGFSLNWVSWGVGSAAREKRIALNFRLARESVQRMLQVLCWAGECDPELSGVDSFCWQVDLLRPRSPRRNGSMERFVIGKETAPTPSFAAKIRDWAQLWFGPELNRELCARHRCVGQLETPLTFEIKREQSLSAHQQLEAFAQLRDFLAQRVAPDELQALLRLD